MEGFKREEHPKLEAYRGETGNALIAPEDATILAVASDVDLDGLDIPVFDLNHTDALADFVLREVGLIAEPPKADLPDLKPPKLKDDCFALPAGVDWVPVDDARSMLRERLPVTVGRHEIPIAQSLGRILADDIVAPRSNPPGANSAVDGYGFAHSAIGTGAQVLPLVDGRAAAGSPFVGAVPAGQVVRILTGALLPQGVDTVVMQEDVQLGEEHIAIEGGIKPGANARRAGEDVLAGDVTLSRGRLLGAPDLALMSAVGCTNVPVFERLRVGILSTGDEIVPAGSDLSPAKTYDANRPMLLGLVEKWGYEPVDLGHVGDDRDALRESLNLASARSDIILTSGGASAGDEDHLSALLGDEGALFTWRIAIKPGRPLALAQWNGTPVFGLPGNPVAALVCTLIFARPAMSVLAGGDWVEAQGFMLPAAFEKRKKPGRREYLRARVNRAGEAEVFASEGSGRISGLSWADGLVELEDGERHIRPGDPVRYFPYSSFGF